MLDLVEGTLTRKSSRKSRAHSAPSDMPQNPRTLVPLFSTEKPFAYYIKKCEEHAPQLKELGLFSHFFNKWPTERVLQREVVLQKLLPLMKPSHESEDFHHEREERLDQLKREEDARAEEERMKAEARAAAEARAESERAAARTRAADARVAAACAAENAAASLHPSRRGAAAKVLSAARLQSDLEAHKARYSYERRLVDLRAMGSGRPMARFM